MTASEALEKTKEAGSEQTKPAGESDKHPGTMFDPETIRKFLEQIKKEDH